MQNESLFSCQVVYPARNNFSKPRLAVLLSLNVVLTILNLLVNVFLIYALVTTNQLKSVSRRLIVCLSVSDIGVSLFHQNFISVILGALQSSRSCALELTSQFFGYVFPQTSGVMILIIAYDRWLHMKYLHRYSILMSWRRACRLVFANVALSVLVASASIIASIYKKYFVFIAVLIAVDFNAFVLNLTAYILTYRSTKQHTEQPPTRYQVNGNTEAAPSPVVSLTITKKAKKRDTKLAKTMILILVSLTACFIPYFVVVLYWSYMHHHLRIATSVSLDTALWCSFFLGYFNSTLNAVIFIMSNKKTYTFLKTKLRLFAHFEVSPRTENSGNEN